MTTTAQERTLIGIETSFFELWSSSLRFQNWFSLPRQDHALPASVSSLELDYLMLADDRQEHEAGKPNSDDAPHGP